MSNAEQTVEDFLVHHRYDPPERDGWYSAYEVYAGIFFDLGRRVRSAKVFMALHAMQKTVPPKVEDSWLLENESGIPITTERYQQPDQPEGAKRYYRALQSSVEYIPPQ